MKHNQTDRIVDLAAELASKADSLDQVIILYRENLKEGEITCITGSLDNDLEVRDALWLVENYKLWLLGVQSGDDE